MDRVESKQAKSFRQRYFVARELQFSIALLVVLALLGGIFLQILASALINYLGFNIAVIGVLLVLGYVAIVFLLAIFFTYRLVGPFKRLEYEMKLITAGDREKRLTIRTHDDLHVRNFVGYSNNFISNFQEMSSEYERLSSTINQRLEDLSKELAKEKIDCKKALEDIAALRHEMTKFKKRW